MGEVIHVNFGEVHYSASFQGVLSKRIQAKLDQLYPNRWNRADRIAAQVVSDMKSFDKRIEFTLTIERPVDADGAFSEQAFKASAEKSRRGKRDHELRKAAHCRSPLPYSTSSRWPPETFVERAPAALDDAFEEGAESAI